MRRAQILCIAAGIVLFLAAELAESGNSRVRDGRLVRSPPGGGEQIYSFDVEGLEEKPYAVTVAVPEQALSGEKFQEALPGAIELLSERICGENPSLTEVRQDLKLVRELPEYGLSVSWESESPELISDLGLVALENVPESGETVFLKAKLFNALEEEQVEIPVTVLPQVSTVTERFLEKLRAEMEKSPEAEEVALPDSFEGQALTYKDEDSPENLLLIFLGFGAAACLPLKERSDREKERQRRLDSLTADYPDLVSRFLVLTGAGYPVKQVWRKQVEDLKQSGEKAAHPLYEEMEFTLNQMEAGTPELQAYEAFGRRLGLQCYIRFVSLLESSLSTSGKNLRRLLEEEMAAAFQQRQDLAKRKGEEASTRLLLPMFLMLLVVMVIVVAPAFLSLA